MPQTSGTRGTVLGLPPFVIADALRCQLPPTESRLTEHQHDIAERVTNVRHHLSVNLAHLLRVERIKRLVLGRDPSPSNSTASAGFWRVMPSRWAQEKKAP